MHIAYCSLQVYTGSIWLFLYTTLIPNRYTCHSFMSTRCFHIFHCFAPKLRSISIKYGQNCILMAAIKVVLLYYYYTHTHYVHVFDCLPAYVYVWFDCVMMLLHCPGTTGEHIVLVGDSAGGNFAMATAMKILEYGE